MFKGFEMNVKTERERYNIWLKNKEARLTLKPARKND